MSSSEISSLKFEILLFKPSTHKTTMRALLLVLLATLFITSAALAQSTAFTYQGRLTHSDAPATGLYEITFALYNSATNGHTISTPITLAPVPVTNGLFIAILDFGPTAFTGAPRWLELSLTVFGSDQPVVTLAPRQPLTPTPYALHAANAAGLMSFINAPLDVRANGQRVLRLEPRTESPNIIGGSSVNHVAPAVVGAFIGGGGTLSNIIGAAYTNSVTGDYGVVAGGLGNSASGGSFVGGGSLNRTDTAGASTISGGSRNTIHFRADAATIGGGSENTVRSGSINATISGGGHNTIGNEADGSTIGGGAENTIEGVFVTIDGGLHNSSGSHFSTVGGGESNTIYGSAFHATIAGGAQNAISEFDGTGLFASIGGGLGNRVNANGGTVAGGSSNHCSGEDSTIGGGLQNQATARYATVAGGSLNSATGRGAFVGGGGGLGGEFSSDVPWPNVASGNWSVVAGGANNFCDGWHSTIGGGYLNNTMGGNATVAGGRGNDAGAHGATVGGGRGNSAYEEHSTIAGGHANSCGGEYGAIGGGQGNEVGAREATVGGGFDNRISIFGEAATIPGGVQNRAEGPRSFAAGSHAHALHQGAFVWADAAFEPRPFVSTTNNEFSARARGGVRFVTAVDTNGTPTAGVSLAPGSGTWSSLSDRKAKENFTPTEPRDVLDKVAALPIATWNYKSQDQAIRHIGPTAQDFHAAFNVGENDRTITTVDADGVALAAIQGLNQKLEQELKAKDSQIRQLQSDLTEIKQLLQTLTSK